MESQPVTTNPFLIMLINMTVVFAVLWALSWIIRFIRILDPTQKKEVTIIEAPAVAPQTEIVAAPIAQPDDTVLVAILVAAVAAYGYSQPQIVSIRRIDGRTWTQANRIDAINASNKRH